VGDRLVNVALQPNVHVVGVDTRVDLKMGVMHRLKNSDALFFSVLTCEILQWDTHPGSWLCGFDSVDQGTKDTVPFRGQSCWYWFKSHWVLFPRCDPSTKGSEVGMLEALEALFELFGLVSGGRLGFYWNKCFVINAKINIEFLYT
jgi:hypothetical protein